MAEPEVEAKAPAKPARKSIMQGNLVRMLLGVAIFAAIMAIVGYAAFFFTQKLRSEGLPTEPGLSPNNQNETVTEPPYAEPMGVFTLIITDESGRNYTLKTEILLTVHSTRQDIVEAKKELLDRKPQLIDGINEVLYGTEPKNFIGSSAQRLEGISEMKASIIRAVNARMKTKIDGVLLKSFIFQ